MGPPHSILDLLVLINAGKKEQKGPVDPTEMSGNADPCVKITHSPCMSALQDSSELYPFAGTFNHALLSEVTMKILSSEFFLFVFLNISKYYITAHFSDWRMHSPSPVSRRQKTAECLQYSFLV